MLKCPKMQRFVRLKNAEINENQPYTWLRCIWLKGSMLSKDWMLIFVLTFFVSLEEFFLNVARNEFVRSELHGKRRASAGD